MNKSIICLFFGCLLLLSSCKTKQQPNTLNYLQTGEEIATEVSSKAEVSTIQNGDQLVILITAKDMTVVKPFNQNYSSVQTIEYSKPNSNQPLESQENISGPTYLVDSAGNIDFPVLGKMSTSNKTLSEFKENLTERLRLYVKDPTVSIRISNYKVTILGEVENPGQYIIADGQATVLNALGLAGDLTLYGKRDNILIVRNINGEITKSRINLMDGNFTDSPFYQLKQGDVLYISSNQTREKEAKLDPNTSTYIAIAGTIIGLAGIFITIFKN